MAWATAVNASPAPYPVIEDTIPSVRYPDPVIRNCATAGPNSTPANHAGTQIDTVSRRSSALALRRATCTISTSSTNPRSTTPMAKPLV